MEIASSDDGLSASEVRYLLKYAWALPQGYGVLWCQESKRLYLSPGRLKDGLKLD